MPNRSEVREALCSAAGHALDGCDVHAETWPAGCSRPFVLVAVPRVERTDLDRFSLEETLYAELTYFAGSTADVQAVDRAAQGLMDAFRKGFLPVGDRAVKVAVESAHHGPNRARLHLSCVYTIPRDPDPEMLPLMGNIDTIMQV